MVIGRYRAICITGTSRGLGHELALQTVDLPDSPQVFGLCRNSVAGLSERSNYRFLPCDLSNPNEEFTRLRNELLPFDKIDFVLNAAAFRHDHDSLPEIEVFREIFEVNFFANIRLLKAIMDLPVGKVVFVNSVAGLSCQNGQIAYSASKHALRALSQGLAQLSKSRNFSVISVNPGGIDTPLWENQDWQQAKPEVDFLRASTVANMIVYILQSSDEFAIDTFSIKPKRDI